MINTKIKLITFFVAEDGETVQLAQTRARADCGSDDQLFIEKFRLKLKNLLMKVKEESEKSWLKIQHSKN